MIVEDASRDFRLVPIAAAMWSGCLLARMLMIGMPVFTHSFPAAAIALISMVLIVLAGVVLACCRMRMRKEPFIRYLRIGWCRHRLMVLTALIVMALSTGCTYASLALSRHDPLFLAATLASSTTKTLQVRIDKPMRLTKARQGDCQSLVRVLSVQDSDKQFDEPSYQHARLYAYQPVCQQLRYGATVSVHARVSIASYDPLSVQAEIVNNADRDKNIRSVTLLEAPSVIERFVNASWNALYQVTDQLDEQARMLVPGLTIGLLGQEYVAPADALGSSEPIDDTYATLMRQHFQHAGIMHLMAVSGGHFLLLADFVRRLARRLMLSRTLAACLQAGACLLLSVMVYPSASVWRALAMGILSSLAYALCRPYQSVSALSVTVIVSLLANPSFAWDYAFSLSCAATFGIVVMSPGLTQYLSRLIPRYMARMVALTFSAQCWTLPIQLLMQPEISLMAFPINMLVAPLVDIATIAGLLALACAASLPQVSLILAWFSSLATSIMQSVASFCDEMPIGIIGWWKGLEGVLLLIAVQLWLYVLVVVRRLKRDSSQPYAGFSMYMPRIMQQCKQLVVDASQVCQGSFDRRKDVH